MTFTKPDLNISKDVSTLGLTTIDSEELLDLFREVKDTERQILQVKQAVVDEMMKRLESGKLDDLRDAGEDRWVSGDMTLTLGSRTSWKYSEQTVALAQQLKEAQKAEQENGDAKGVTKTHFVARFD